MPKVYVAGALIPTGGAYMAYRIGRLVARRFGYELVDVHVYDIEGEIFDYDTPIRTITIQELEKVITAEDVLIANPSFSQFLFGLLLPGKKIMYLQGFYTFMLLDCHFDLYVSVSQLVSRYAKALYDIDTKVIPAFIESANIAVTPWEQRPEGSALVYIKHPSREHQILHKYLKHCLPHIDFSNVLEGRGLTKKAFLQKVGSVRYLINLSLAEGFGLVPLEAMMMGTMVTGVDGLAGADYMKQGENCLVGNIKNLKTLPSIIQRAFEDEALAQKCIEGGKQTAAIYSHDEFEKAWLPELEKLLNA
jgi:glycosyltransferase involved in cell wall biosynthesis